MPLKKNIILSDSEINSENEENCNLSKNFSKKTIKSEKKNLNRTKEAVKQMHSETQRIIRDSSVNIPYHHPEKLSLDDVLAEIKIKQQNIFTKIKPSMSHAPKRNLKMVLNNKLTNISVSNFNQPKLNVDVLVKIENDDTNIVIKDANNDFMIEQNINKNEILTNTDMTEHSEPLNIAINKNGKTKKLLENLVIPQLTPKLSTDLINFDDSDENDEVTQFQNRILQHIGNSKKIVKNEIVLNTVTKESIEDHEELKMNQVTYKFDVHDSTPGSKLTVLQEILQNKMRVQRDEKLKNRYELYNKMTGGKKADRLEEDCIDENSDNECEDSSESSELEPDSELEDEEELAFRNTNPFIDAEAEDNDSEDEDYVAEDIKDNLNDGDFKKSKNIGVSSEDEEENNNPCIDAEADDDESENEDYVAEDINANLNDHEYKKSKNIGDSSDDDDENKVNNEPYDQTDVNDDNYDKLNDPVLFNATNFFLRKSPSIDDQSLKQTPIGSKESSFEWNSEYSCSLLPAGQPLKNKQIKTPIDIYTESSNAVSGQESKCSDDLNDNITDNFIRSQIDTSATYFEKNNSILETSINTQNPEFEWLLGSKNKIADKDTPKFSLNSLELSQCANDDILMLCSGKFSSQELHFTQPDQSQSDNLPTSSFNFGSISLKRKLEDDNNDDGEFHVGDKRISSFISNKRKAIILDDDDYNDDEDDYHNNKLTSNKVENDSDNSDENNLIASSPIESENDIDEEEILHSFKGPDGKIKQNFIDEEAELSGEDDGISENELNDPDDEMEIEEGDADELGTEEELKDQIHRIHLKTLIDEDNIELFKLREKFLPDWDLQSDEGGRMKRRFQWNIKEQYNSEISDEFSNFLESLSTHNNDDSEMSWRLQRLEREKYINSLKADDSHSTSSLSFKSASMNDSSFQNSNAEKSNNFKIPQTLSRSGSFLNRNREILAKVAGCKSSVNLNPKNSRNFVFSTVSSPEKNEKFNLPNLACQPKKSIKKKSVDFSIHDSNSSSNLLRLLDEDSYSKITL